MHLVLILKEAHPKEDVIFLDGENNHASPSSWRLRTINWVVRSTLAAGTIALTKAAEQNFYIRDKIIELLGLKDRKNSTINAITDNQSLFDSINSTKTVDDK